MRATVESAAAELGATSLAITEHADGFDIAAHWPRDTIRRWSVPGLDSDNEVDHGEFTLRRVDEGGDWIVATFESCVEIDDELVACHVSDLAVDVEALASHGLRAVAYRDEDGSIGSVNPHRALIATPPRNARFPTERADFEGDIRCECIGPDGARWIGTDDLPTGQVLRWDGHAFVAIDAGTIGMVRALVTVGDGVLAAVSSLTDDGQPGFVHIRAARYGELHMTSSRVGTRFTWGVTAELATRVARRLGGIAAD